MGIYGNMTAPTNVTEAAFAAAAHKHPDIAFVKVDTEAAGVTLTHVAETHLHNDYVTGGR